MSIPLRNRLLGSALITGSIVLAAPAVIALQFQAVTPEKSAITFNYKQMGVPMDGKFRKFASQVSFDPEKPADARGRLDIDLASIDTGNSDADQEVLGKLWFNAAAHPRASFVLGQLKQTGTNLYEATGQLTIKGQTREQRVPLKLTPSGSTGALAGSFVIKRAEFGIGEGTWSKFDVVANEITVNFQLNLK